MADRENVIRALNCLSRNALHGPCNGCAYFRPFTDDPDTGWCDRTSAMNDALILLREQEPVEPKTVVRTGIHENQTVEALICGNCYKIMGHIAFNYCPWCGKKVKWDG